MPRLYFRSGLLKGRKVPVPTSGLVVGRDADPGCDLALGSSVVSGKHAAISLEGNRWKLRDLGSRNGTLLNEQAVDRPMVLSPGAIIVFGDVECVFEDDEPPPRPEVRPLVEQQRRHEPQRAAEAVQGPPPQRPITPPPEPAPPEALKVLRQGVGLLRRSGASGAGLVGRLRQATDELSRAASSRDAEGTRQVVTRLLDEEGALSGLADELAALLDTTERSLNHFDKVLQEAEEQRTRAGR